MTSSVSFLFTRFKFAWVNCPNVAQYVKPKHVSPKLESTTMVDDYCAGGRVSDEYQRLCACASPSSSVCWRKEEFVRVLQSLVRPRYFDCWFFLSHTDCNGVFVWFELQEFAGVYLKIFFLILLGKEGYCRASSQDKFLSRLASSFHI
jgi:hypothetical protein